MARRTDSTDTRAIPPRARARRRARRPRIRWLVLVVLLVVLLAVIAVAGLAGAIVALSRNLPDLDSVERQRLAQNTVLFDRNGRRIAELYGAMNRVVVSSRFIPDDMKDATVAVEDKRFYEHHGVDFNGVARAVIENVRAGGVVQGGSTITEQFVKNAYVGSEQSFRRKLREAVLAWQLEDQWPKDKILTEYLNAVYYGAGAYGVEAAAETYFHKPITRVTLPEAALLAALPKFPSQYSPTVNPKMAKQRRDLVLDLMAEQGYITVTQAARAKRTPLDVFAEPPRARKGPAAYFVDYVTRQLVDKYGSRMVFEGGLKVYTSIDMTMQRDGTTALKGTLPPGPAGALVAIDPANGYIRAMVASTDFKKEKYNVTWQAARQAGSAMKPFALIAAVEEGANPATTFYNSHPLHIDLGLGADPRFWNVNTYDHSSAGRINLVQATLASDNTVYAQLCMDVHPKTVAATARKMGITSPLDPVPSIVLGTQGVSSLEMANAYATLANGGILHRAQSVEKVVFPDGRVVKTKIKGKRVLPAGVAYVVSKILEQNTKSGTAAAMPSYYTGVSAGKTGTTDDSKDAWFCGFNPKLATAVWMGYWIPEPMGGIAGATYCVPIWGKFYNLVFGTTAIPDFAVPANMPVWKQWEGKYSKMAPKHEPKPTTSSKPQPTTQPTVKPTVKPTQTPTTKPTATASPNP